MAQLPLSNARPPPSRSISAIAAAYAKEKRDASLVRDRAPERIDGLLFTELQLRFEHDLVDLVGCAADRCSRRPPFEAQRVAQGTMLAAISHSIRALESLETRLNARTKIALGNGRTVQLTAELRAGILADFSDAIAELVRSVLPQIACLSDSLDAIAVRTEAKSRLYWVRERWEAVLLCKTQITDLLNDNDLICSQRQQDLFREAVVLLQAARPPSLRPSDVAEVVRFLTDAILRCPKGDTAREDAACSLTVLLLPRGSIGPDHTWVRVAARVLSNLGDHAREHAAAVRLQAFCRGCSVRRAFLWRQRKANAHAIFPAWPQTIQPLLDPVLLAQSLLRQAIMLSASLTRSSLGSALTQLQRRCSALGIIDLASLKESQERMLSFWLNVRNLGVLLAVLLAAPFSVPRQGRSLAPRRNAALIDSRDDDTLLRNSGCYDIGYSVVANMHHSEETSKIRRDRRARTIGVEASALACDFGVASRRPDKIRTQTFGASSLFPLHGASAAGPEMWAEILCVGSLLVGDAFLTPSQIDHHILQVGHAAPLPAPAQRIWHVSGSEPPVSIPSLCSGELESWVAFGLWLPVRFGLPPLRIYRPDVLLVQLRLNAQTFLDECSEVALIAGQGHRTLALPPLLQVSGLSLWRPLLGIRGEHDIASTPCDIEWTFDPRRFAASGMEDYILLPA